VIGTSHINRKKSPKDNFTQLRKNLSDGISMAWAWQKTSDVHIAQQSKLTLSLRFLQEIKPFTELCMLLLTAYH